MDSARRSVGPRVGHRAEAALKYHPAIVTALLVLVLAAANADDPIALIKACAMETQSAENGACYRAGYVVGSLKKKDKVVAAATDWDRACDQGNVEQCNYAGIANQMKVLAGGIARARVAFERACNGGIAIACQNAAEAWEAEPADVDRRDAMLAKACDGGLLANCNDLGLYLVRGDKPKDPGRAIALFTKACDGKLADGCDSLGIAYKDGIGAAKDPKRADEFFSKACDLGAAPACAHLGHLRSNGDPAKLSEVRPLFEKSCSAGFGPACFLIGISYYEGQGVPKDLLQAVIYFKKACDARARDGCIGLGQVYRDDPAAGKVLFKKACAQIGGCADFDAFLSGINAVDSLKH